MQHDYFEREFMEVYSIKVVLFKIYWKDSKED